MSSRIADPSYYFWGVKNEDEGLFYFCSKDSVLEKLAEKSTAGIAGWTFSEEDYYYGMSWSKYQPLENYLSKVISVGREMFKSESNKSGPRLGSPLPKILNDLLEPTTRSMLTPPKIVAINTGIKTKVNNKRIYALCIHRDYICDEEYSTYLRINRAEKNRIVQEMVDNKACYYMYDLWDEKKQPENLQVARGEAPPSFYGKIYEMAININNLKIDTANSILGDLDHFYEHMDRIPREPGEPEEPEGPEGLRPRCINQDCINRVNDNSDFIFHDNRIDNRDKNSRIMKQRIRDFKNSCPKESRELFEQRMEDVIHDAIERVKRNPRLAIPYGLNDTNRTARKDMLSLGQFVIPLYNEEGEVFLGLTLRCKVSQTSVKETTILITKFKEKKTKKIEKQVIEEIVSFRECTYSADTILPLPIVRMNVLPYVDCDVSNLWCFPNH